MKRGARRGKFRLYPGAVMPLADDFIDEDLTLSDIFMLDETEHDENEELSPLAIPTVTISLVKLTTIDGIYLKTWNDLRKWVNDKHPQVLYQADTRQHTIRLYFKTKELYMEFIQTFPWVLK